jgi:hypothetical protein
MGKVVCSAVRHIRVLPAAGVYVGCKLADGNVGCEREVLLWNAVALDPHSGNPTGIEGAAPRTRIDTRAATLQSSIR